VGRLGDGSHQRGPGLEPGGGLGMKWEKPLEFNGNPDRVTLVLG